MEPLMRLPPCSEARGVLFQKQLRLRWAGQGSSRFVWLTPASVGLDWKQSCPCCLASRVRKRSQISENNSEWRLPLRKGRLLYKWPSSPHPSPSSPQKFGGGSGFPKYAWKAAWFPWGILSEMRSCSPFFSDTFTRSTKPVCQGLRGSGAHLPPEPPAPGVYENLSGLPRLGLPACAAGKG